MKRNLLLIIYILLISGSLSGRNNDNIAPGNFLKIGTSSRFISRGEALIALVDDASALTINPAGLAVINKMEILFSHYELLNNSTYEHFSLVKPVFNGLFGYNGIMGWGISYLHSRDSNDNSLAFITGYGQKISPFEFGFSIKLIREQIDNGIGYAIGGDLGLTYDYKMPGNFLGLPKTYGKNIKTSILLQNAGSGRGINNYKLPACIKFGIGTEIIYDLQFEIGVEKYIMDNMQMGLNIGMEYCFENYYIVRMGYRFLEYQKNSFTLGIGIQYPLGIKLIKIDAAYMPAGVLKNSTDLSIGVIYPGVTTACPRTRESMLYYKGIYYFTNDNYEKAIELWEECLKHDPDFKKAKEKIKEARKRLKEKNPTEKKEQ